MCRTLAFSVINLINGISTACALDTFTRCKCSLINEKMWAARQAFDLYKTSRLIEVIAEEEIEKLRQHHHKRLYHTKKQQTFRINLSHTRPRRINTGIAVESGQSKAHTIEICEKEEAIKTNCEIFEILVFIVVLVLFFNFNRSGAENKTRLQATAVGRKKQQTI